MYQFMLSSPASHFIFLLIFIEPGKKNIASDFNFHRW